MSRLHLLLPLAGACILSQCGYPERPVRTPSEVLAKPGEGGKIVIYRGYTTPGATAARIHVDGAMVGYVSAHSSNTFELKPGEYQVAAKYPPLFGVPPAKTRVFTLHKGETVPMKVTLYGTMLPTPPDRDSGLVLVGPEEAAKLAKAHPSREE